MVYIPGIFHNFMDFSIYRATAGFPDLMPKESSISDIHPGTAGLRVSLAGVRVARSVPEKAPFARYTRFLAGAVKIIALR